MPPPTKPNPRYHALGQRIAALPTELVLQIIGDLTLSRLLELVVLTPALTPAVYAHAGWTALFTTVRPPPPREDNFNYDSDPADNKYLLAVKRDRRKQKKDERDAYDGFIPRSVLPEVLAIFPLYLCLLRLAMRTKPPHVFNVALRNFDIGNDSTTMLKDDKNIWEWHYWGFSDLLTEERNFRHFRLKTPEDLAARERQRDLLPRVDAYVAPRHQLAEKIARYLYCEIRFYLVQGYEMYLPILSKYTDFPLPTTLMGDLESMDLPSIFGALRDAEKNLNAEKASQLIELAALVEKYPGWLIPLNRPHKAPFPPSLTSERHLVRNYRRWASQLTDESRSRMLEKKAIADHIFGCDRHPLVPHDLLLQGLISVIEKYPPIATKDCPWTESQISAIHFFTQHLGYVTPHSILPVRPPAPYDPHSNIYALNPLLVPSKEPPIRTFSTPFSPDPPSSEKHIQTTPHFHLSTYVPPNLSPFRHAYGKNIHARPVRFNLPWYRSRKFRNQTPAELRVFAPKGEDRWGGPGRLSGTMLPIEENERKWLSGFLEICEAVRGMRDVQWGEETVAAWWERTVETGIKNGVGIWEDVVGKAEKLKVDVEND